MGKVSVGIQKRRRGFGVSLGHSLKVAKSGQLYLLVTRGWRAFHEHWRICRVARSLAKLSLRSARTALATQRQGFNRQELLVLATYKSLFMCVLRLPAITFMSYGYVVVLGGIFD
jgi:hypothetical protein